MKYASAPRKVQRGDTSRPPIPKWGWLYALGPLLLGLLLVARRQPLTRAGHIVIQCAIVLLVYGLMALWVQANRAALSSPKRAEKPRIVTIVYAPTVHEMGREPVAPALTTVKAPIAQGIAALAFSRYDRMSLQERRN